jgi:SAM-dependent methyltransferase
MPSDAANRWTEFYTKNTEMMYPAEAVIRIFKGTYPNLKMPRPKAGDSILDVGCGDGRHFPLFDALGMEMAGTEITTEIVDGLKGRFRGLADIRVGTCAELPWRDASFDYLLTWNSCYYMGLDGRFEDHVAEMARVLKTGGWIVCSVPKESCFIFDGSEQMMYGYRIILNDYFGLRNGEQMRCLLGKSDIELEFGDHFTNFCHASIDIDMFGLAYNWHVFVAERRS